MRLLILGESRMVHVQRWAGALGRRGWDVGVLGVSTHPIPGVQVMPLVTPEFNWSRPRRWWGRYTEHLCSTVRDFEPDLVQVHYLHDYPLEGCAGHSSGEAGESDRLPLVISTWGADIIQDEYVPIDTAVQRRRKVQLLQSADAVTATTSFLADRTAEFGRITREDITVIPFGVDLKAYQATPEKRNTVPVVGFIKHLEPKYGAEQLVRAAPAVLARFPTARFVMVGQGSQETELRDLARRLEIGDRFEWRGRIPNAEVPQVLAEMDVYAMPSVSPSETFGVSAVEAQAAGVPVVFSDLPGVREAVTDGVGGLAVTPGDVDGLAAGIVRLLTDDRLRRDLGENGREVAYQRFDFQRNVDQMEAVFRQVLQVESCGV